MGGDHVAVVTWRMRNVFKRGARAQFVAMLAEELHSRQQQVGRQLETFDHVGARDLRNRNCSRKAASVTL